MNLKSILCGSDTMGAVAQEIIDALKISGQEPSLPYGEDKYTKKCKEIIRSVFEKDDIEIFPVISGTASNSLAISTICSSHGFVLCHENSHINKDECGAPEFFSNGGKLLTISSDEEKINISLIKEKYKKFNDTSSFKNKIQAISVSQLAENGTVYFLDELEKIGNFCKNKKLFFHMDGARFANALLFLEKKPSEITWKIGLDCLSLGATKNGAFAAEVVVFFNPSLAKELSFKLKKTGHVLAKTKLISSQLNAWFKNDLWLRLAKNANKNALNLRSKLEKFDQFRFIYPTHGNEIFAEVSCEYLKKINSKNIFPKLWLNNDDNKVIIRFVTSFDMKDSNILEIVKRLETIN